MKKAMVSILIVYILINVSLFAIFILNSDITLHISAATIIVDDDGTPGIDCNYTTIQEAINAANHGDTVFVKNGTYYENVLINKTITLLGNDRDNTTINGGGFGDIVEIQANGVNITNFSLVNGNVGIKVFSYSNNTISNNNISKLRGDFMMNDGYGIYLGSSSNNSIFRNKICDNIEFLLCYLEQQQEFHQHIVCNTFL
jgi:nitrous oxidase accessory protein NosD